MTYTYSIVNICQDASFCHDVITCFKRSWQEALGIVMENTRREIPLSCIGIMKFDANGKLVFNGSAEEWDYK